MPQAYDEFLVPRLYTPWARKLIERARIGPHQHVLDVATGPGTVARIVSPLVGIRGRVAAVDTNPNMLAVGRAHDRLPHAAGIEYHDCSGEELPFEDHSFHVVTCQQGFQYFKHRDRAAAQILRVLHKGGRVTASIWGPLESVQYWHAIAIALKRSIPSLTESFLNTLKCTDAEHFAALFESVGFSKVEVHTETIPLVFEDGIEQAVHAVKGTEVGPRIFELGTVRHAFEGAAIPIFKHFLTDRGAVFPMTAHVLTAVKAH